MIMADRNKIMILLIEDDPGHARLIERNLRRTNIINQITTFSDGQQVIDYLFSQGEYVGIKPASFPLMLLDLNLPVLDGYQVLKRVKEDERTKRIPVIVLTTTDDTREVAKCYELGCNVYITKPIEYAQFLEAIRNLGLFLSVVTIPDGE